MRHTHTKKILALLLAFCLAAAAPAWQASAEVEQLDPDTLVDQTDDSTIDEEISGEDEEEVEEEGEEETPSSGAFSDVPAGAYYSQPVDWAVQKGITSGTSATTFSPGRTCSRAEIVTLMWRSIGSPAPQSGSNPFRDVTSDKYYYNAVLWAVENNITSGTSAATFSPSKSCTRDQIVTFLWNFAKAPEPQSAGNPFSDVTSGRYYYKAVLWAMERGITSGTDATHFAPQKTCSRAEAVTFLYRYAG